MALFGKDDSPEVSQPMPPETAQSNAEASAELTALAGSEADKPKTSAEATAEFNQSLPTPDRVLEVVKAREKMSAIGRGEDKLDYRPAQAAFDKAADKPSDAA